MTQEDPLALVGTTVSDKYEIESVVGTGGFATVYRARHTVWNRAVAIKVFRALGDLPPARRNELVEGFIQEGRLLAELSERSAAICQARDVGTLRASDGREMPFMVLEWLEGRTLEEVLAAERGMPTRSAEEVVRLLEPAAEALALAHKKGIVHRDVKPANIFIVGDSRDPRALRDPRGEYAVKLLDFGIAKVVQDVEQAGGFAKTQGVVSSFTPAYGAPEQFSRAVGPTGPWTDVFALALIFTELLTQEPGLRGDDLTQLAFSAMDPRRRPTPRASGYPTSDALEAVLGRALAVSPAERFQTMSDFWAALRDVLALTPGRGPWTTTGPQQQRESMPYGYPTASPVAGQGTLHPPTPGSYGGPTLDRSLVRPGGGSSGAPKALLLGIGIFVAAGLVAVGVRAFWGKNAASRTVATVPSASALSAPAPIAPLPPPPTCPSGMTKIPGGKFFMGSDDRKDEANERPAHQVILSPYCMDTTEVTVAAYKECSDNGECKRGPRENEWEGIDAAAHKLYDPLCNIRDPEARATYPINCIDWELGRAFCVAKGKRLPTEAEWEFATRGSDGRKYPWGDDAPTSDLFLNACGKECVAWGRKHPDPDNPLAAMYKLDDGWPTTAPVGTFPKGASPFGLQDVVGNVWEWVSDWYAPYAAGAVNDPVGPESGTERVLRGGAWNGSDAAWVRPTYRFKTMPTLRSHGIGMRCAKTL